MLSKIWRTIAVAVLGITLVISFIANAAATGFRQFIYRLFDRPNYWDLENEWTQFVMDVEVLTDYWRWGNEQK